MSERKMAERYEWVANSLGHQQAVERTGETARVFWRGTAAHGWSWWSWDAQVGLELLRVVHERDEALARLALPTSEVELIAQRWEERAEDAEERASAAEALGEQRDVLGKALVAAVAAAAEGGLILEALRLAVTDELSPQIMRAIEPALAQIHAAMESLGALRAAGLLEEDS